MNVVIAAGGTGGHFFPALALAEEFCDRDPTTTVTLIGTGRALEQTMVTGTDIRIERIAVQGVIGRGIVGSFKGLLLVPKAIQAAMHVLRKHQANLVIGTGGYTSPPVLIGAWLLGIKRAILEPNAIPGIANRVLGPVAQRVFVSFEDAKSYFPKAKVRVVGTPIRNAFSDADLLPPVTEVSTVLVCGGSQGAKALNTAVVEAVKHSHIWQKQIRVIHQTGDEDFERVRQAYEEVSVSVQVVPFLQDMPSALGGADLVITRCGALTLAEIAALGKPSILVPFPQATHHHQEKNARAVEKAGAGIVMLESELTGANLAQTVEALRNDPSRVQSMAQNSLALKRTNVTDTIVQECYALVSNG